MSFWTKRRFPSIPSKPISLKSSLGPSSPLSIFLDHTFLATSFLIQTSGHRFKTQLPHECRSTKHTVTGTHFAFHSQTLNQPRPSLLKRQKTKDKRQKTKRHTLAAWSSVAASQLGSLNISGAFPATASSDPTKHSPSSIPS